MDGDGDRMWSPTLTLGTDGQGGMERASERVIARPAGISPACPYLARAGQGRLQETQHLRSTGNGLLVVVLPRQTRRHSLCCI